MKSFAGRVIEWQQLSGRHDLPWQRTRDPYRIWLSEIMLQQTQVAAVVPYYGRFLARFPDLAGLAAAEEDDVLALWSGLGYYARGRNLHRAARMIMHSHAGVFPKAFEEIVALPGIGRSTAGAISVFAFGVRQPILDGNVKRVFARTLGIAGFPGEKKIETAMWAQAAALLPPNNIETYTQGLMDLGAGVCTIARPRCDVCPLQEVCVAKRENRISELPTSRPTRPMPEKSTVMLILQRDHEVLLEKRPAPGIWGGLWSFPEIADLGDAARALYARFGLEATSEGTLPDVNHGFTHYALTITPALLRVTRLEPRAHSPGHVWLTPADAIEAAVPAPVRKILRRLQALQEDQAAWVR
ncbi:MAG: A/G-specific adenine glycosylase [Prolixibacteraceae bacterium]|nr:A/G-specific adenine glycosylase [Burkholderiales bacterium]